MLWKFSPTHVLLALDTKRVIQPQGLLLWLSSCFLSFAFVQENEGRETAEKMQTGHSLIENEILNHQSLLGFFHMCSPEVMMAKLPRLFSGSS
jgi:hypothetical protein